MRPVLKRLCFMYFMYTFLGARNPFGTDALLDFGSPVFIDVACFNQVARRSPTPNPRQRVHKFPAYSGCHWTEAAKDRGLIYKPTSMKCWVILMKFDGSKP